MKKNKKKKVKEEKKTSLFKSIKMVSKYFLKCKKYLVIYALVSLFEAVMGVIMPLLSAKLIMHISGDEMHQLLQVLIIISCLEIVSSFMMFFKTYTYRRINRSTMLGIQMKVADETLKIKTSEIDANSSGLFVDRLNKDTGDLSQVFMETTYWITNVIGKIGIVASVFIMNKIVFVYSFITAIFIFLIDKWHADYRYKSAKEIRKLNEEKTGLTSEVIRGSRDVKVLNAGDSILNKIRNRITEIIDKSNKMDTRLSSIRVLARLTSTLVSFFYIVLCMVLHTKGYITIAVFITLFYYKDRVKNLLSGMSELMGYLKNFQLAFDRVNEIIDGDKFEKEKFGNVEVEKIEGNIEFKNVTFGYEKGKKILNKMNFTIKPNEKVAFVGKSGAGKTTLFSLLTKLYDIDSGSILLDGYNLNDLSKGSIRNNISLITQNPYIFNFTIKENFTAVKENATMKEIREACKLARIDDYIMSLPNKYNTKLGENGVILSGGQKQRIAIARALLLKTEIILFDEATSALDNETQKEITTAINNMQGEYTILIVAHRLSTIIDCDRIFIVDDGKIIGEGTHEELIKNNQFYKDLYLQEM
jgi:ABC-type multidrug transport system fused ATPase/permease subunit